MNEFVLNRDVMNELEDFSVKFEQLRIFIDFVNNFVWQEINEDYEGETVTNLACLTNMLSDVAHIRENELEAVIKKISCAESNLNIIDLLNSKEKQEFDELMYGEDGDGGLILLLPSWEIFDNVGTECICCLIMLKRENDLSAMSTDELYSLYALTMRDIAEKYPEIEGFYGILSEDEFIKFINLYPQIIEKPFA